MNIKVENLFFLTFSCLVVVVTFLFGDITEYGIFNGFNCSATKDVEKLWLALRWEKSIVTLYVTTQNKYTWEKIGIILNMFIIHRKLLACKDSFTDVIPDEINQSTFFNYP